VEQHEEGAELGKISSEIKMVERIRSRSHLKTEPWLP